MPESDKGLAEENLTPEFGTEARELPTPWGFICAMTVLGIGAVLGQALGLGSLLGFNEERNVWEAREETRRTLTKELDTLQDRVAKARAVIEGADAERELVEASIAAEEAKLKAIRTRLEDTRNKEVQAQSQTTELLKRSENLRVEIDKFESERNKLVTRRLTLIGEESDIKQKVDFAKSELDRYQNLLDRRRNDLSDTNELLSTAQQSLLDKKEEIAEVQPKLSQALSTMSEAAEVRESLMNLRSEDSTLQVRVDGLLQRKSYLTEEINSLNTRRTDLLNLLTQSRDLEKKRDTLANEVAQLRENRVALTTNTDALEKEKKRLLAENNSQREILNGLDEQIATAISEESRLKKKVTLLRQDIPELIETEDNTKLRLGQLQVTIKDLEKQKRELELSLKEDLQAGQEAMGKLAAMLVELAERLSRIIEQLPASIKDAAVDKEEQL